MEGICVNVVNPHQFFFDSSRDVAMVTNFGQNLQNDLHSAPWYFKTELNIAMWISSFIAQMIPLHRVQIWWTLVQQRQRLRCENFVLLKRYDKKRPISPNISTATEPISTNISALVAAYMRIIKLT